VTTTRHIDISCFDTDITVLPAPQSHSTSLGASKHTDSTYLAAIVGFTSK
jgi:hypothetical protein